jgi:phospholipid transport system substrate-binding protein
MTAVISKLISWVGMFLVVNLLFLGSPSSMVASHTPTAVVKSGTDKALEVLKSRHSDGSGTLRERRDEIYGIIDQYFSFTEMAKRALGRPWKDQTPDKQQEFTDLFKQLLFNTYVDRVDSFTGGVNEQVLYDAEMIEGKYALVKTRLVGYRQNDVVIEYRLYSDGGEWKVYDVVVEGISFINNYRQQFNSILANESFEGLLSQMKRKLAMQNR